MKDQEVTILMNDLAADYDMFRMKELGGRVCPNTGYIVQAHADDAIRKEAPQT
jgi:hypothetical protein